MHVLHAGYRIKIKAGDRMAGITARKNKKGEIISYRIRVSRGYDSTGKKLKPYETTFIPTPNMTEKQIEKELNRIAVQFEEQCKTGIISSNPKLTLNDFIPQYLDTVKSRLSPTTYSTYQRVIERLVSPMLGHLKMKDIKPVHIQEFIKQVSNLNKNNDERQGKISASSVKRYLTVIQSIFKQAVKLDIIAINPASADKLTLQRITAPKVEIFTKQETAEILSYLEKEDLQFQVLIQLAIMTGARRGELTALKFSDFDYTTNKVTIERTAVKITNEPTQIKPPKDYEVRTIAVNQYCIDLVRLLKSEKIKQAEKIGSQWHENDWLFTQWNGEIMNPHTPTKQFSKFLKRHNLKHRKFHSLRHTSATLLLYGGVNIKQVQERLGHGDIETTNKYLHYIAEADEQAVNVLQDMLITKSNTMERNAV